MRRRATRAGISFQVISGFSLIVTFGIVSVMGGRGSTMSRALPYPLTNDWRRGCWVARPDGKADRDYVYSREFMRGRPDKASGMVRYSLDDLGGVGWVVVKDRRGVRSLIRLEALEWVDYGDTSPRDVLRVVRSSTVWDGARCDSCEHGVLLEGEALCAACEADKADSARIEADLASAPGEAPF